MREWGMAGHGNMHHLHIKHFRSERGGDVLLLHM